MIIGKDLLNEDPLNGHPLNKDPSNGVFLDTNLDCHHMASCCVLILQFVLAAARWRTGNLVVANPEIVADAN